MKGDDESLVTNRGSATAGGSERFVVDASEAGLRLDKLLARRPSVGSREKARNALETGKVSIDGRTVGSLAAGRTLAPGAVVELAWNRPGTGKRRVAGREALDLAGVAIVHEDDDIVVCDKPAGLLTDAADEEQARHEDTLRKRLRSYLCSSDVWPAHRIDRDTTGLVCFARTERARRALLDQWAARTPERAYLAVLTGAVRGEQGRFRDWMAWDRAARRQRPSNEGRPGAVLAEADWRVVERFGPKATLLEVRLVTGRRNQIRLHAELFGHPLAGEVLYRGPETPLPFDRQALHAWKLGFRHPSTGTHTTFESPLPRDLCRLLASLRSQG